MPRLSQTALCFLQSPSFRQAQSALLTQCIVIGRTTQAASEM